MNTFYELLTISPAEYQEIKKDIFTGKIGVLLSMIIEEVPKRLKHEIKCMESRFAPIYGFEDDSIKGYKIIIDSSKKLEEFIQMYIPFIMVRKKE
jgi:hypothetical protein